MQKVCFGMFLMVVFAASALAQGSDDYHKVEGYAGYIHGRLAPNSGTQFYTEGTDSFTLEPCTSEGAEALGPNLQKIFCDRRSFHGFDTSITYNFTKYLGIKGNFTGLFKSDKTVDTLPDDGGTRTDTNRFTERTYNFLAGLQVKNNSKNARFKPFAHALAGVARQTVHDVQTSTVDFNFTLDDRLTSFAMKLGGGLDVRVSRRIDLRLAEVNYNPIFARDRDVPGNAPFNARFAGRRADNFTVGFGIVIH